ncbi:heat-inducible transcription repressor HrcA [Marinilactibacillus piezotolerans]|uniref:Heat-inducible transcription repressor HrcA n=1 Tax=Marinilactibacillus piezotolerans TaxID=258723 RepID=A0A1I3UV14_9LACT|nr:heat-inducible transcriptional repressor HrcA [Marinilactibacillus piezotolerans]SFJ85691.1 heat-inducible transcription repressor HrcA [Marinilactibacillus piezotolerans]
MLTERQLIILETIIRLFTSTSLPVGSKKLVDETNIEASSATIRNEMSSLEKMGFIEKTHSSSGRIPSLKGYRFYIDHLIQPKQVEKDQIVMINKAFGNHVRQMDDLFHQSAQLLSQLTSYTAFVLGPQGKTSKLTGFRLVLLNNHQVMAIIQTDTGAIENTVFRISKQVNESDIEKVTNIFNQHLVGYSLYEVYFKLQNDIPLLVEKYASSAKDMLITIEEVFGQPKEDRLHISGKTNLLDFTDHMDRKKLKSLYELLDNELDLNRILSKATQDFEVKIGTELNHELFDDFSLVTATYKVDGHGDGIIAVLGPTSMPYDQTFGVLEVFRKQLADTLLKFYLE